ncbi:MAG: hypothetical protein AAB071_02995 [Bacteroidota bacterium]
MNTPNILFGFYLFLFCFAFAFSQESPHGNLTIACTDCHTTTSFSQLRIDARFDHTIQTNFSLNGQHKIVQCQSCHTSLVFSDEKGKAQQCISCHTDQHRGEVGKQCERCHNTKSWVVTDMLEKHQASRFPLLGVHRSVNCKQCHTNTEKNEFVGLPLDCAGCHRKDFDETIKPNHIAVGIKMACEECHQVTSQKWNSSTFQHLPFSFMKQAAHSNLTCEQCHNKKTSGTPTDCYGCHKTDFNNVQTPNHLAGQFSHQCATCHQPNTWIPSHFNHSITQFPLAGAHLAVQCQQCHSNGNYSSLPVDCYSCHQNDFGQTTNPNHATALFSHQCEACHSSLSWTPSNFNHANTNFPLTGSHLPVQCQQCHTNGNYTNISSDCWSCHENDFAQTTNPNHTTEQFSHQCETCHNTIAFQPSTFDHSVTQFPLTGTHTTTQCQQCHTNGNYTNLPTDCWSCHETDFTQTTNPNHVTAQFSHQCETCHQTAGWQPALFDHSLTQFPLTGAHQTTQCQQCHTNGNYTNLPTDCWSCHETDFTQTTNPNHVTAQFSHQCETCHQTAGWQPALFDHSLTQFPLTGAHQTTQCQQCHTNGNYTNLPTDCWSCHETDFTQTTNPNHVTAQFAHDCSPCHNTSVWQPSTFNHANTIFPLTGAHNATPCQQCHINGNYSTVPTDCWSCHESDYTTANDPPHSIQSFPHNCTQCHTTQTWDGASFNHSVTSFPLTGAHQTVGCQQCHINGNYTTVPTECYPCHTSDFTSAPQHSTKGYPHNCTTSQCHSTSSWSSTFNHTPEFPIGNGTKHRPGRWNVCGDCHQNANNFAIFTCTTSCHPQAQMNNEHDGVSGYQYQSNACYDCHPTGDNLKQMR